MKKVFRALSVTKSTAKPSSGFGVSLKKSLKKNPDSELWGIPKVLQAVADGIISHGLDHYGVFSTPIDVASLQSIEDELAKGDAAEIMNFPADALGASFKVFFAKLPDPLVPKETTKSMAKIISSVTGVEDKCLRVSQLLSHIPPTNLALLHYLVCFLLRANQLDLPSIFGPLVFRMREIAESAVAAHQYLGGGDAGKKKGPTKADEQDRASITCMEFIMVNMTNVFTEDVLPQEYVTSLTQRAAALQAASELDSQYTDDLTHDHSSSSTPPLGAQQSPAPAPQESSSALAEPKLRPPPLEIPASNSPANVSVLQPQATAQRQQPVQQRGPSPPPPTLPVAPPPFELSHRSDFERPPPLRGQAPPPPALPPVSSSTLEKLSLVRSRDPSPLPLPPPPAPVPVPAPVDLSSEPFSESQGSGTESDFDDEVDLPLDEQPKQQKQHSPAAAHVPSLHLPPPPPDSNTPRDSSPPPRQTSEPPPPPLPALPPAFQAQPRPSPPQQEPKADLGFDPEEPLLSSHDSSQEGEEEDSDFDDENLDLLMGPSAPPKRSPAAAVTTAKTKTNEPLVAISPSSLPTAVEPQPPIKGSEHNSSFRRKMLVMGSGSASSTPVASPTSQSQTLPPAKAETLKPIDISAPSPRFLDSSSPLSSVSRPPLTSASSTAPPQLPPQPPRSISSPGNQSENTHTAKNDFQQKEEKEPKTPPQPAPIADSKPVTSSAMSSRTTSPVQDVPPLHPATTSNSKPDKNQRQPTAEAAGERKAVIRRRSSLTDSLSTTQELKSMKPTEFLDNMERELAHMEKELLNDPAPLQEESGAVPDAPSEPSPAPSPRTSESSFSISQPPPEPATAATTATAKNATPAPAIVELQSLRRKHQTELDVLDDLLQQEAKDLLDIKSGAAPADPSKPILKKDSAEAAPAKAEKIQRPASASKTRPEASYPPRHVAIVPTNAAAAANRSRSPGVSQRPTSASTSRAKSPGTSTTPRTAVASVKERPSSTTTRTKSPGPASARAQPVVAARPGTATPRTTSTAAELNRGPTPTSTPRQPAVRPSSASRAGRTSMELERARQEINALRSSRDRRGPSPAPALAHPPNEEALKEFRRKIVEKHMQEKPGDQQEGPKSPSPHAHSPRIRVDPSSFTKNSPVVTNGKKSAPRTSARSTTPTTTRSSSATRTKTPDRVSASQHEIFNLTRGGSSSNVKRASSKDPVASRTPVATKPQQPEKPKQAENKEAKEKKQRSRAPSPYRHAGERLYSTGLQQKQQLEAWAQKEREKTKEKEVVGATFRPEITELAKSLTRNENIVSRMERDAERYIQKHQEVPEPVEPDLEECTFTPRISARSSMLAVAKLRGDNTTPASSVAIAPSSAAAASSPHERLYSDAAVRKLRSASSDMASTVGSQDSTRRTPEEEQALFNRLAYSKALKDQALDALRQQIAAGYDPATGQELFKPQLIKAPVNVKNKPDGMSVNEYLYAARHEFEDLKNMLRERHEAQIITAANSVHALPSSQKYFEGMLRKRWREVFDSMRAEDDQNDVVKVSELPEDRLTADVRQDIVPLLQSCGKDALTFAEFVQVVESELKYDPRNPRSYMMPARKRLSQENGDPAPTFKPTINPVSEQMASNQPARKELPLADRLVAAKQDYELNRLLRMEAERRKELEGCTFTPELVAKQPRSATTIVVVRRDGTFESTQDSSECDM